MPPRSAESSHPDPNWFVRGHRAAPGVPDRAVLLVAVALSAFSVGLSSMLVGWTAWGKEASASVPVASAPGSPAPKRAESPREACAVLASR
jgi:hypothetical protein